MTRRKLCRFCEAHEANRDLDDLCDECWATLQRPTVEWTPEQQERLEAAMSVAEEVMP